MEFSRWRNFAVVFITAEVLAAGVFFVLNNEASFANKTDGQSLHIYQNLVAAVVTEVPLPPPPPQKLLNPPEIIKAVYVTGYSAGSKKYLNYLANLFKTTEINAVVVNIKGSDGYVSYASKYPSAPEDVKKYNLTNYAISDIDELVNFFHEQNIYVIGRISVFEDPVYSKARPEIAIHNKDVLWQDNNGLSWLDPASKDVWDYNISLAKDAFYNGFDEVNFDYVRFPSDGKTDDMGFPVWDEKTPKADVIKEFFNYTRQQLAGEKISVDLFGQTTTNRDDMGIGQVIENAFENFDYVSPMVYPSHYINGFMGFANPAEHPYEIINYEMATALSREKTFFQQKQNLVPTDLPSRFRPWLQDFNMGADYSADMIKSEIKATQDSLGADYTGFMLWNPLNIYTKEAVASY